MTADPAFSGERLLLPAIEPHLDKGEKVFWAGRPNLFSLLRTQRVLMLIGAGVLAMALYALMMGWFGGEAFMPIALIGIAFLAGPLLSLSEFGNTAYAITNRGALIVHDSAKLQIVRTPFREMDDKLEILETGYGAGHVYFASGKSTKLRDTDYQGKLAFRNVLQAQHVARVLEAARKRNR